VNAEAPCVDCGHPEGQHDDGGCMWPKWDKSGGTRCYCAAFEFGVEADARARYVAMLGHHLPIEERRDRIRRAAGDR
jgi:hypothetical protein